MSLKEQIGPVGDAPSPGIPQPEQAAAGLSVAAGSIQRVIAPDMLGQLLIRAVVAQGAEIAGRGVIAPRQSRRHAAYRRFTGAVERAEMRIGVLTTLHAAAGNPLHLAAWTGLPRQRRRHQLMEVLDAFRDVHSWGPDPGWLRRRRR